MQKYFQLVKIYYDDISFPHKFQFSTDLLIDVQFLRLSFYLIFIFSSKVTCLKAREFLNNHARKVLKFNLLSLENSVRKYANEKKNLKNSFQN